MRRWSPEKKRQARVTGFKLRSARVARGLAQHELASALGIGQKRVSALELGESDLSLHEVAEYLSVELPGRC